MRRKMILNSAITAIALGVIGAMTVNLKDGDLTFQSNPSVQGSAPSTEDAWHGRGSLDDSSYGGDAYSYDGAPDHEPSVPPGLEWGHQPKTDEEPKRH